MTVDEEGHAGGEDPCGPEQHREKDEHHRLRSALRALRRLSGRVITFTHITQFQRRQTLARCWADII
jgi:hypothetical protein